MPLPVNTCCASGSLHTGVPTGEIVNHHGRQTYVAKAPNGSPKGIVVIIPDAFGIGLLNNRILADDFAKKGNFDVYLPDFMNGYILPLAAMDNVKALSAKGIWATLMKPFHIFKLLTYFLPWLYNIRRSSSRPQILGYLKALRNNEARTLSIGVAGYCWGGYHVSELCWDQVKTDNGRRLVDAGFMAHPSMLSYPKSIDNIILPMSVAACEHDPQMSAAQSKETEAILKAKTAKTKDFGVEHEFVFYEGVHHGFAVRADEDQPKEADAGKKAQAQAIAWFAKWFASPPPGK